MRMRCCQEMACEYFKDAIHNHCVQHKSEKREVLVGQQMDYFSQRAFVWW